ncbi:MAG TPA: glucosidase [bacterium]|nr:glucosidase [bacterium]
MPTPEHHRIHQADSGSLPWRRWGPYLAERQWGTVREDYSAHGDAWKYVTYETASQVAYRWGEDGLGGFCDDRQRLCLAPAFWNGHDPCVKERLFGLTGPEGNHGEDVKELYYYLDAVPSHAYQRLLYKYPQRAFPYDELRRENARRGKDEPEFEITDTDAFVDNRYFDIEIEWAKAAPEDILWRITAHNRGPEPAPLHVLAQCWFRNIWAWGLPGVGPRPHLKTATGSGHLDALRITHSDLSPLTLYADGQPRLLVCDNETNPDLFPDRVTNPDARYFKDGINRWVLTGDADGLNPKRAGTRAAFCYPLMVPAEGSVSLRLRLIADDQPAAPDFDPFADFDELLRRRRHEADLFYEAHYAEPSDPERCLIQRQAWAGLLWSKQYYRFDVRQWLRGDPAMPPPPDIRRNPDHRNVGWEHLRCGEIFLMPDKWEFPWFAAWDLAFHCLPVAQIDPWLAKQQLLVLLRERLMHPSGQLPAYEWQFSDVNPPVHAWAAWRIFKITAKHDHHGGEDFSFLEAVFQKLLINFTWWVNRKDREGRNLFQGGFLGLDNIGVFDRSAPLPNGGCLEQADATSWMAMYALTMMRMALELTRHNPVYEDMASKFFEHFLYIAGAMQNVGGDVGSLWDEDDEFYYDALLTPDGRHRRLRVRSMVGLIPLFAVEVLDPELFEAAPHFATRLNWFLTNRPELATLVSRWQVHGRGERQLLSLLRGHRVKALLRRMLDEAEFLSEYGIRSLSRVYARKAYSFAITSDGPATTVAYEPAESHSSMFGGNSNWRGPVWFPVNFLLIESLQRFHHYFGDDFLVEFPTGTERFVTLREVADALARGLLRLFLPDPETGTRPLFGQQGERYRDDPHFQGLLLFPEYFHGDNGRGCGASHQTGWTALIAKLIQMEADDRRTRPTTPPPTPA